MSFLWWKVLDPQSIGLKYGAKKRLLDEENLNPVDCTRFADWPGPFVNLNPVDSTRFLVSCFDVYDKIYVYRPSIVHVAGNLWNTLFEFASAASAAAGRCKFCKSQAIWSHCGRRCSVPCCNRGRCGSLALTKYSRRLRAHALSYFANFPWRKILSNPYKQWQYTCNCEEFFSIVVVSSV
jgi:hypothetical protein